MEAGKFQGKLRYLHLTVEMETVPYTLAYAHTLTVSAGVTLNENDDNNEYNVGEWSWHARLRFSKSGGIRS